VSFTDGARIGARRCQASPPARALVPVVVGIIVTAPIAKEMAAIPPSGRKWACGPKSMTSSHHTQATPLLSHDQRGRALPTSKAMEPTCDPLDPARADRSESATIVNRRGAELSVAYIAPEPQGAQFARETILNRRSGNR